MPVISRNFSRGGVYWSCSVVDIDIGEDIFLSSNGDISMLTKQSVIQTNKLYYV